MEEKKKLKLGIKYVDEYLNEKDDDNCVSAWYELEWGRFYKVWVNEEVEHFLRVVEQRRVWRQERSDRRHKDDRELESADKIKAKNTYYGFEDMVIERVRREHLHNEIKKLEPENQKILKWYYWWGESMEWIGKRLKYSKMAVSKRLKVIRKILKEKVW